MVAWKIHVPDALDTRVRRRMGESGETLSGLVRVAVDAYLHDTPPMLSSVDPITWGRGEHGELLEMEVKVRLPAVQGRRLKQRAEAGGMSMGRLARIAIDRELDRLDEQQPSLFD